jgi:hypothetical protein
MVDNEQGGQTKGKIGGVHGQPADGLVMKLLAKTSHPRPLEKQSGKILRSFRFVFFCIR